MAIRNLADRIDRLEEVYSPPEVMVIMVASYPTGEVKGWKGDGYYIKRNPGESEEALKDRAITEAKSHYQANPPSVPNGIVLHMDHESVPYVKPEPEPATEPEPAPAPVSAPVVAPKPQPRMATIKEIEGQYADRRHWMS